MGGSSSSSSDSGSSGGYSGGDFGGNYDGTSGSAYSNVGGNNFGQAGAFSDGSDGDSYYRFRQTTNNPINDPETAARLEAIAKAEEEATNWFGGETFLDWGVPDYNDPEQFGYGPYGPRDMRTLGYDDGTPGVADSMFDWATADKYGLEEYPERMDTRGSEYGAKIGSLLSAVNPVLGLIGRGFGGVIGGEMFDGPMDYPDYPGSMFDNYGMADQVAAWNEEAKDDTTTNQNILGSIMGGVGDLFLPGIGGKLGKYLGEQMAGDENWQDAYYEPGGYDPSVLRDMGTSAGDGDNTNSTASDRVEILRGNTTTPEGNFSGNIGGRYEPDSDMSWLDLYSGGLNWGRR